MTPRTRAAFCFGISLLLSALDFPCYAPAPLLQKPDITMPVYHLYFSPCSSTYDTTYAFCRAISQNAAIEVNLTDRETEVPEIPAGSVAVVAAPVYAGRIPTPMADKLARARLEGVKVVTFAVYGGRAYEDALLELNDLCEKAGATVLASAATLAAQVDVRDGEHGRPHANDFAEIKDFGRRVCEKYAKGETTPVIVPGNRPYRPAYKAAFVPETDTAMCRKCGVCVAACPTGAIDAQDPSKTDINLCINCMRCAASCASGAKAQPAAAKAFITARLSPLLGGHKPNEFYV